MKHRHLHDAAKFAAGLVVADFFSLIWYAQSGMFPLQFLGVDFNTDILVPGLIFDFALILILIHYGWNIGKIPRIRESAYLVVAGCIFSVVALAHLWRIFGNVQVQIDGWDAPLWLSWFGVIVTTYLAYASFVFATRLTGKR